MTHSFGESPSVENVSRLSQILEDNPHPKYCLSEKACQGILNRANKRGKKLPKILEQALIRQSASKNELESQGGGKGILIQNEHTGALSTLNNQSVCYGICSYASNSMKACLRAMEVASHKGDGISEDDISYTLNSTEQHGVIYSLGHDIRSARFTDDEITDPLTATDYKDPIKISVSYGGDNTVGALCARDYKGVGSQYAEEGKVIVQSYGG